MPNHLAATAATLIALCCAATDRAPGQQPAGKARAVKLKADEFDDAERVPLVLRHPITAAGLPPIAGRAVPLELDDRQLRLDLDGDGRFEDRIGSGRAEVVAVPPADGAGAARPLLIAHDETGWWAAPASALVGKHQRRQVVLLDGDLDGRFDGEGDWVGYGDGSLHRVVPALPWLADGDFLGSFTLTYDGRRFALEVQPLGPAAEHTPLQWRALQVANGFRTAAGLPPTRLDPKRCDGCQKHALYLQQNNYDYSKPWDGVGSHDEVPGNPGYTEAGHWAAKNHATSGTGDAAGAIDGQTRTMLHRLPYLGAAADGIGVGAVDGAQNASARGYSVIGGPAPRPADLQHVVVVPAPGQREVPTAIRGERPDVQDDPTFYQRARGYPVSVSWGSLPVTGARLLLLDGRGAEVAGRCFTPEHPIHPTRPSNGDTAFFVADRPLDAGARYTVEFTAQHGGAALRWRWSFTTQ